MTLTQTKHIVYSAVIDDHLIQYWSDGTSSDEGSTITESVLGQASLPQVAISNTFVVASQAAMLALTAQEGDVAVRSDLNKTYILTTTPATTLGNWQELLTPTDSVLSVDGLTGAVSLPVDAVAGTGSKRTLGTSATSAAAGNDSRLTNARVPTGAAGGALSGTYPDPGISAGLAASLAADAAFTSAYATIETAATYFAPAASKATYAARSQRTTAGSIVANGTNWANLDTSLDLTLTAITGNFFLLLLNGLWSNEAYSGFLDVVTVVGGSPINSIADQATPSNSNQGIQSWRGILSVFSNIGGGVVYSVVAGDISSGTVTFRLRVRTSAANNKTLLAAAATPLIFSGVNLG